MSNRTPLRLLAKRLLRARLEAVERRIFRDPDLDAVARGWTVSRPGPFVRTYRDPRWDQRRVRVSQDARS